MSYEIEDAKRNYEKVKNEMKALLVLFVAEHLLMCVPIWILSYNIYQRNIYLDEYFPQLDEEIWSTTLAYTLSTVSPIILIIVPFVQYGLFVLYNKYGHPWRRLLQENVTIHSLDEELEENSNFNLKKTTETCSDGEDVANVEENIPTENGHKDDEMECASLMKNTLESIRDEIDIEMEKLQVSIEVNNSS